MSPVQRPPFGRERSTPSDESRREVGAEIIPLRLRLQRDGRWLLTLPVAQTKVSRGGNQVILSTGQLRSWHLVEAAVLEQLVSVPSWSPGSARRWRVILANLIVHQILALPDLQTLDILAVAQQSRDEANLLLRHVREQTGRGAAA